MRSGILILPLDHANININIDIDIILECCLGDFSMRNLAVKRGRPLHVISEKIAVAVSSKDPGCPKDS
jgi:hypothetical protein